jgi:hypothetical protein
VPVWSQLAALRLTRRRLEDGHLGENRKVASLARWPKLGMVCVQVPLLFCHSGIKEVETYLQES